MMATGQHERQALRQLRSDDEMSITDVVSQLDLNGVPVRDEFSLIPQQQSLTVTVMKDAWKEQGRTLDEPGTVDEYWFEGLGIVLLDFNNE